MTPLTKESGSRHCLVTTGNFDNCLLTLIPRPRRMSRRDWVKILRVRKYGKEHTPELERWCAENFGRLTIILLENGYNFNQLTGALEKLLDAPTPAKRAVAFYRILRPLAVRYMPETSPMLDRADAHERDLIAAGLA